MVQCTVRPALRESVFANSALSDRKVIIYATIAGGPGRPDGYGAYCEPTRSASKWSDILNATMNVVIDSKYLAADTAVALDAAGRGHLVVVVKAT